VCTIHLWSKERNQKSLGKLLDLFISFHFVPPNKQQAEVVKSDDIKLRGLVEKYVKKEKDLPRPL